MAELLIRTPGQPDRRVPLPHRAFTVGRHESCDVQILEVKASKKHFEVAPAPHDAEGGGGPAFVVTDLQSSNGTFVGEARIMRRLLGPHDEIRVGDTRVVVVLDGAGADVSSSVGDAPSGIRISKGLVVDAAPEIAAATVPSAPPAPVRSSARVNGDDDDAMPSGPSPEERRAAAAGRRSIVRGVTVFAVGVVAVLAVELFVSKTADKRQGDRAEAQGYLAILAHRDDPFSKVESLFEDFRRDFPLSSRTPELQKLIDARRSVDARFTEDETEFNRYVARLVPFTDSEVHGRLTELLERHGRDGDRLKPRIEKALADLSGASAAEFARDRAAAKADVDRALAEGNAGAAIRRWRGLLGAYPALRDADRSAIADEMALAAAAATSTADAALAKAETTADPDARRQVLLTALRGLDGTAELDRVASVLRRVTGGAIPTAGGAVAAKGGSGSKKGGGEAIGLLSADVLGKIADAEALARGRKWFEAAKAYDRLLALNASERVKADWTTRRTDVGRVMALVSDLKQAHAAAKDGVLAVKVGGATWDVLAVEDTGVRAKRSGVESTIAWPEIPPRDLIALLAHGVSTPDRHLALATLAADLGDRPAAVEHLIPLMDLPTHMDLAAGVMAHRMEGRTSIPEGGYKVLDGDLLDFAEWTLRTEARHLADLKAEAIELVKKASEDPALEKLHSLRARREELDRRRAHALLAIFNEKHWPYPHSAPSMQVSYGIVTGECEKRWKAVEEIWAEPSKGAPGNTATLEKLVARHAEIVKELAEKEIDVEAMATAMEPYAIYVGAPAMNVRTFFTTKEEKDILAYSRFVMEVYNPEHTSGLSETEIEQIRITNEYRMMMGFLFVVEPGPAAYEAIDAANVVTILDQAKETLRRPLKAVRIDERLWKAARAHSDDMSKRGFFAHEAPANPATGEAETTPPDRMRKAGYMGNCGENIATSSSPMGSHLMWLHSSGHHRNILTTWEDMGMGFGGARATQDFGSGGGVSDAALPEGTTPVAPSKRKKRDPK